MEAQGDGEWDLIFFFSNSRSKNWKMGALAGNGSYKEMRKFAGGYATPSRAREAAGSTSRAGSVDPQSPTLGFLSDHRCTYLESAYHTDTLKSVTFQRKPTRMGAGGGGEGGPSSPKLKSQETRADFLLQPSVQSGTLGKTTPSILQPLPLEG